jgi:hypothetical protein
MEVFILVDGFAEATHNEGREGEGLAGGFFMGLYQAPGLGHIDFNQGHDGVFALTLAGRIDDKAPREREALDFIVGLVDRHLAPSN